MQDRIKRYIDLMIADRRRRRKNAGILCVLALLVVSGIFWQMRITGITMSDTACCGKEEHVHSEECLGERQLICGFPEEPETTPATEAQPTEYMLICQTEEHTHGDDCYTVQQVLNCEEDHEHTAECYGEEQVLTCTVPAHTHDDGCMEPVQTEPAETVHVHTDECYEVPRICGMEEHTHTLECYSDPKADLETEEDWKATLPEKPDENRVNAFLDIALSQLGYRESERNFVLSEDGQSIKGITRYGQWYGNPYGQWDAMFVSFCLHYAGVEEEKLPYNGGSYAWTVQLEERLLRPGQHQPQAGDLIFFNTDDDDKADHVGILLAADAEMLVVIEGGRENCVDYYEYATDDPSIFGFVRIPEKQPQETVPAETIPADTVPADTVPAETMPAQTTVPIQIYADESCTELLEGTVEMTASGELPEGTLVRAYPVEMELPETEVLWAIQLAVLTAEGEPWEGPLTVSFRMPQMYSLADQLLAILQIAEDGTRQEMLLKLEEDILSFVMERAGVFALAAVPEATGDEVMNEAALKAAFARGDSSITLGSDFSVTGTITINNDHTLDLNGHTLTVTGTNALFNVGPNKTLTIIDSAQQEETVEDPYSPAEQATGEAFDYLIIKSTVVDSATGKTEETTERHTVTVAGRIQGGGAPVVTLTGGTFNLESGVLCDGTNRAIDMESGTANLDGGYIYNFQKTGAVNASDANFGGAVRATGGTLNISGTVLANNEALNGGAIFASNATVNITGGVITGNKSTRATGNWGDHSEGAPHRCGGGGIYATGATVLTMDGGYITNNTAVDDDYFDGGGGVLIGGTTSFILNGGYITGNEAAGGGGVRSDWAKKTTFTMNGGFVSGNTARSAEGGGIAITQGGSGAINGGYITNNTIINTVHWGGGGLFCSDGAYLRVYHVLVTDNSAGGFGGGVAGCSTGRVYICVKDGGAIYDNSAAGTQLSGGGSQKNEDHTYAANSPVFMANGYQDYFCALNSLVEGGMLGGGSANWSGSLDGVAISNVPQDAILEAAYVMGLTSHPSGDDITAAREEAKVFINGNSSYTHGGGILCNGYLLVGDKNPIAVGSRLSLSGSKGLDKGNLSDYHFTFDVTDEDGNVVSVGTSNGSQINFDRLLSFTEELCKEKITTAGGRADFVYYVTEKPDGDYPEIIFDETQYRITVTIVREDQTLPFEDADGNQIVKSYYKIQSVDVDKSTDQGETWGDVGYTYTPSRDEQHGGSLKITNGTTFSNSKGETTSLTVNKRWVGTENMPESITVDLKRNGEIIDTVTLSAENGWTYTWDNLAKGPEYTVDEHPVPGYETDYITGDPTEEPAGWYKADSIEEGGVYLLVSADGYALTGRPNEGGAYTFNDRSWTPVTVENGFIADSGSISEAMKWEAVTINRKDGLYLKNYPSEGKHYLSYQRTDTVQTSSSNTDYASRVESCDEGLRLYKQGSETDIKYVVKPGTGAPKASESNTNALYLYKLSGSGSQDNIITIVNTKTEEVYSLNLTKVEAGSPETKLAGAVFQLLNGETPLTFRQENGTYVYDESGETVDLVTGEDGKLRINGLPAGTYILRETEAPEGYLKAEDRVLTLPGDADQSNELSITVEDNKLIFELPETGGTGLNPFILTGLLLMAAAVIVYKKENLKYRKEISK